MSERGSPTPFTSVGASQAVSEGSAGEGPTAWPVSFARLGSLRLVNQTGRHRRSASAPVTCLTADRAARRRSACAAATSCTRIGVLACAGKACLRQTTTRSPLRSGAVSRSSLAEHLPQARANDLVAPFSGHVFRLDHARKACAAAISSTAGLTLPTSVPTNSKLRVM